MMQTILGAGGVIGIELAKALPAYTSSIRLVSRNPKRVNQSDHLFKADLLNEEEVIKAVEGSDIVYLTAGFTYNTALWEKVWPLAVRNTISACKKAKAKLVFFDNIYMYDPEFIGSMDENTPINPSSKKGKVRKQIAQMILDEVEKGELVALIARSADFYGPSIQGNSVLTETVFKPIYQNKKANWFGSLNAKHSFTYTPDAGKATALLGNTEDAYQQVWHLPTAENPLTGKQWVDQVAAAMGKTAKVQLAPKWLVRIMGLFNPIMKEFVEMFYQYDRDYVFLSKKFEARFQQKATPYQEGIKEIIAIDYSAK
jgi:nucleoside-diphosphate-sugar epimerase